MLEASSFGSLLDSGSVWNEDVARCVMVPFDAIRATPSDRTVEILIDGKES